VIQADEITTSQFAGEDFARFSSGKGFFADLMGFVLKGANRNTIR
jgi:hypothetical protein